MDGALEDVASSCRVGIKSDFWNPSSPLRQRKQKRSHRRDKGHLACTFLATNRAAGKRNTYDSGYD